MCRFNRGIQGQEVTLIAQYKPHIVIRIKTGHFVEHILVHHLVGQGGLSFSPKRTNPLQLM
ncbi:hypothetical protein D3C87_2117890 [compost metagenome]